MLRCEGKATYEIVDSEFSKAQSLDSKFYQLSPSSHPYFEGKKTEAQPEAVTCLCSATEPGWESLLEAGSPLTGPSKTKFLLVSPWWLVTCLFNQPPVPVFPSKIHGTEQAETKAFTPPTYNGLSSHRRWQRQMTQEIHAPHCRVCTLVGGSEGGREHWVSCREPQVGIFWNTGNWGGKAVAYVWDPKETQVKSLLPPPEQWGDTLMNGAHHRRCQQSRHPVIRDGSNLRPYITPAYT